MEITANCGRDPEGAFERSDPSSRSQIPVVILCGGMGTRIRESSERLPKPMIDIGGRPILWHIMKLYGHHGFRRFVLCLGYRAWDVKEYFLRYRENLADFTVDLKGSDGVQFHGDDDAEDWEVTCVDTGIVTGTGGRIGRIRHHIDEPHFLLTYGDGIGDVDLGLEWDIHRAHDRLGTVTVVHPTSRFGEVNIDGDVAADFAEKPTAGGWVSGGFFAFDHGFFEYLSDGVDLFLEQGPLQQLARDRQLAVFRHEGFWMGMDTYREHVELNRLWSQDQAPWKVWTDARPAHRI